MVGMTGSDVYSRVEWMVPADVAILRLLTATPDGLELITSEIARNISYSSAHVRSRLPVLVQAGLIEKIEEEDTLNHYAPTDLAWRFAEDRISTKELKQLGERLDDEDGGDE